MAAASCPSPRPSSSRYSSTWPTVSSRALVRRPAELAREHEAGPRERRLHDLLQLVAAEREPADAVHLVQQELDQPGVHAVAPARRSPPARPAPAAPSARSSARVVVRRLVDPLHVGEHAAAAARPRRPRRRPAVAARAEQSAGTRRVCVAAPAEQQLVGGRAAVSGRRSRRSASSTLIHSAWNVTCSSTKSSSGSA